MALLSTCWLIIESIVIQDGFLKWCYMKLYMHPIVLFLCQLLLWLYLFFLWLLPYFQVFDKAFSSILVMFSKLFSSFLRRREVTCDIIDSRQEIKNTLINLKVSKSIHNPVPAFSFSFKDQVDSRLKVLLAMQEGRIIDEEGEEDQEDGFFYECDQEDVVDQILDPKEGEDEQEEIEIVVNMEKNLEIELQTMPMDQEEESSLASNDGEEEDILNSNMENDLASLVASDEIDSLYSDKDHHSPLSMSSMDSMLQDSIAMENQTHRNDDEDEETDEVYKKYHERMRWYDILSRDRTYGLSVLMNQEAASSLSLWGKTTENRLKQSIEKDLELVYVAQTCLSWEALQHQYIIVRDSLKPADSRGGFYTDDIYKEFQKFQVLLERFLEDETSCEGNKRVLNFVQRRFEVMSFFQVPRLSGYNRAGLHEGEKERKEKEVLKAIEKCIEVFYDFVKIDIKNRLLIWERVKISFLNSPIMELEDPRDIKLFLDLKNSLQKKEQLLKKLQGNKKKKKNWLKKESSNIEEEDENFMLMRFIMIELKLVSRVLHMSLVSSSHLKWCQHKLNNIHFNGGNISRTSSHVLFPS